MLGKMKLKVPRGWAKYDPRWCWQLRRAKPPTIEQIASLQQGVIEGGKTSLAMNQYQLYIERLERPQHISAVERASAADVEFRYYRTRYGAEMALRELGGKLNRKHVASMEGWWGFRALNRAKTSQYPKVSKVRIKYVVAPGTIRSKADNNLHFIKSDQLIRLYGVDRAECFILRSGDTTPGHLNDLPVLMPLYHGEYRDRMQKIRDTEQLYQELKKS
jgi:hypothetical protein